MSMYENLQNSVIKLVKQFGRDMVLRNFTISGDDWNPVKTDVDIDVTMAVTDYNAKDIDGTLIRQNDKKFCFFTSATVDHDSVIVDGSDVYSVINIEEIKPGEVVVAYIVQGRK